jgi:hypothetical protein
VSAPAQLAPRAATTLLLALCDLMVRGEQTVATLGPLDAVEIGAGSQCTITALSGPGWFHLIEIT